MPKIDDMHAPYILPITPSDADVQYFGVIKDILDEQQSTSKVDRTGVGTQGVFGRQMRFDISNKKLPLLTSKKVFTKGIVHELLWMLSGDTNVQYLNAHGVSIWNSWVKPETAQYRRATWDDWFAIIRRRKLEPSFVFMLREHLSEAEVLHFHIKGEFPWAGQDVGDDHPAVNAILKWMKDHDMPERFLVAGELPKIYQHQWRQWEDTRLVPMDIWVTDDWYQNNGFVLLNEYFDAELGEEMAIVHRKIDQIQKVIDQLKTNPDSRRIIVSAWNAAEIEEMALPPCHTLFQFYTREMDSSERESWLVTHLGRETMDQYRRELGEVSQANDGDAVCDTVTLHALLDHYKVPRRALSCQLYQRSADYPIGVPFNIVQYSLLTHLVARTVGMATDEFIWTGGDCHIYKNQFEGIHEQLDREPLNVPAPTVELNPEIDNLFDFTYDDIKIVGYESHPVVKFPPAAV